MRSFMRPKKKFWPWYKELFQYYKNIKKIKIKDFYKIIILKNLLYLYIYPHTCILFLRVYQDLL